MVTTAKNTAKNPAAQSLFFRDLHLAPHSYFTTTSGWGVSFEAVGFAELIVLVAVTDVNKGGSLEVWGEGGVILVLVEVEEVEDFVGVKGKIVEDLEEEGLVLA